jgi:hypothetical protein
MEHCSVLIFPGVDLYGTASAQKVTVDDGLIHNFAYRAFPGEK